MFEFDRGMGNNRRESMMTALTRGGTAGFVGTGAMSVLLIGAGAAGVVRYEPPRKIIDRFFPALPLTLRNTAAVAAHFAYGVAGGAIYASFQPRQPGVRTGLAYGALVWAAGYEGWLPAMGILPPAHRDKPGRALTMLAAHLLYGGVLGQTFEWLAPAPAGADNFEEGAGSPVTGKRPGVLSRLPDSYIQYLADKDPTFREAVLPVLERSAATQEHGVHVRYLPDGIQALVDVDLAYPDITEGVD